jgi:hypothetical protein
MKHTFHGSNVEAQGRALAADVSPREVFFGCASFLTADGRKGENVQAARAFWLDLDVGEGKVYATQEDAFAALCAFEAALGLPPSLVVNSGRGLHVYWAMDADAARFPWSSEHDLRHAEPPHWFDSLTVEQKDACLADALELIAEIADRSRKEWLAIVGACARSGAPSAESLCRTWSMRSAKYEPHDFERAYADLGDR